MYNKSEFSKKIGFTDSILTPPKISDVKAWFDKSKQGDIESATLIFKNFRFCRSPQNKEEIQSINLLCEAFSQLFK